MITLLRTYDDDSFSQSFNSFSITNTKCSIWQHVYAPIGWLRSLSSMCRIGSIMLLPLIPNRRNGRRREINWCLWQCCQWVSSRDSSISNRSVWLLLCYLRSQCYSDLSTVLIQSRHICNANTCVFLVIVETITWIQSISRLYQHLWSKTSITL